ncbi:MAG: hypothetical protein HQ549_04815 [Candidatus Omnitrophica bacterium]|nr:hypothetical protein [Candidatus Omnitrophota bacterium]
MMLRIFWVTLLLLSIFPTSYLSGAEWQDAAGGIADKEFYAITEAPGAGGTVYMGTASGLYRSPDTDGGWEQLFVCRGQYRGVNDIYVGKGDTVHIATKRGLYKSQDSGKTWNRIFSGMGKENYCTRVVPDHEDENIIYLGTLGGLFRTEDGGKTWEKMQGRIGKSAVSSVAIEENASRPNKIFIICDNEVYAIDENFIDYKKLFAAASLESLTEGFDDMEDLSEDEESETSFLLNDIIVYANKLYLSTNRGLFISDDRDLSWTRFNSAGLSSRHINYALLPKDGRETIFVATKNGVFKYLSLENVWQKIYAGMDSVDVKKLMIESGKGYLWALCKEKVYRMAFADSGDLGREPLTVEEILSKFNNEPTINETVRMAIDYAEVYPEKIKKWRTGAKFKALFPKINFGIDQSQSDTYEIYTSSATSYWMYGPRDKTGGWDLNFSWDLSDLVWNDSQTSIDVRSKLMVQLRDDVVDEVTRFYFERRRLQIEFLMNPPKSMHAKLEKHLRIQELTAGLDGLTGGRFSGSIT